MTQREFCAGLSIALLSFTLFSACVIVGPLLFVYGYRARYLDNLARHFVVCNVTEYNIYYTDCSCNCYNVKTTMLCDTCGCIGVKIGVTFKSGNKSISSFVDDEPRRMQSDELLTFVKQKYPLGVYRPCYYSRDDFSNVKFELFEYMSYYIGSLVLMFLAAFVFTISCCMVCIMGKKIVTTILRKHFSLMEHV